MSGRTTPGGFPYRQQPHEFCGSDTERQGRGDPGHCEDCASVGHIVAHPELGCGDVGCYSDHKLIPTADQARLAAAVKTAWAEAIEAHERVVRECATVRLTGGDVLEERGDVTVLSSSARSVWEMAMEIGTHSGDWHRAVTMGGKLAQEILARPLSTDMIGAAVGQVRAIAMQAVLTRMDELLTAHGYDPIVPLAGQPPR